ncbi:kinase-like domain-containing protein [Tuber indicum]|nr:kinase-like domain-containing protein [Tuber indicum]
MSAVGQQLGEHQQKRVLVPPPPPTPPSPPSSPTNTITLITNNPPFTPLPPSPTVTKANCVPSTTPSIPDRDQQRDAAVLQLQPPAQPPLPHNNPAQHGPPPPTILPGLRLQTSNLIVAKHHPNTGGSSAGPSRSTSSVDPLSPASAGSVYSPAMEVLAKMTPLPSPIVTGDSPGPWNKYRSRPVSRKPSQTRPTPPRSINGSESALVTSTGESLSTALAAQPQRKLYQGFTPTPPGAEFAYNNNSVTRSRDDFDTSSLTVPYSRSQNLFRPSLTGGPGTDEGGSNYELDASGGLRMRREDFLAQPRRWTVSSTESSPALSGSTTSVSSISSTDTATDAAESSNRLIKKHRLESFEAKTVPNNKVRKWRGLRLLGHGTFSKVILATSEDIPDEVDSLDDDGVVVGRKPLSLDPRKLVAVKIVEHGAAGGASKERVESSLKRELDILKSVNYPALVRLRAYTVEPKRALLILPYCPGGDLFDLAADSSFTLEAPLVRRMFAEIVGAVRYLHRNGIVHRDVKLENVLINYTKDQLLEIASSPYDLPFPITTLTDVGLSRRVDFSSDDYLLTTRCGSDDYASPELIMAQEYDGRQTDAWALGVLLFALMEGRLPFDPPPGSSEQKMRSKTAHRIARCEWKWVKLAPKSAEVNSSGDSGIVVDVNGNEKFQGYDPEYERGKHIVEGLLKRASKRWILEMVEQDEWVKGAILVGMRERDEL